MTNYTKTTDFAAKDALPSGNSAKIVKGSEIDTEFNNIATASATKANKNNAALTGTTTFETISDGTIAITAFVDEDNMASNSATLLPTQQSVKAYVDSQVTAQDLDFQADTGGALSIDLDSETFTLTGGTGIDTSGLGNAVTFAIDSTVATLTGSQTLSNKTLSAPVVSGNLTTDGLIDGRDVATDGTKLDGIESGATADQTAAEIKTAYESNANTNAFTDADESKLDGIEALADVTDTANVTAAGALMDSELTNITAVKALNQGVATTDSPTFAGLTTTADVSFGDNDKAIFGAGPDLRIYHDGSNSYINDTAGTGNLYIASNQLIINNAANNENMARFAENGAATLYYDGSAKIATTSTGIDVTGTVTADGLTVDGTVDVNLGSDGSNIASLSGASAGRKLDIQSFAVGASAGAGYSINATSGQGQLDFQTAGNSRLTIDAGGDISFYEDTGTTPKLFWDASAESLGIGTSSPAGPLHIFKSSAGEQFISSSNSALRFVSTGGVNYIQSGTATSSSSAADLIFTNVGGSGETMRIDASGNVGIGVTPSSWNSIFKSVQIGSADPSFIAARTDGPSQIHVGVNAYYDAGGSWRYINSDYATRNYQSSGSHYWETASSGTAGNAITFTQAMTLDASGNLGIGGTTTTGWANKQLVLDAGANASAAFVMVNDTTGRTGTDGSVITLSGSDMYLIQRESANMIFRTANTERMRIDSSGQLILSGNGGSATNSIDISYNGNSGQGSINADSGSGNTFLTFGTSSSGSLSEAMRIDSSRNLLVGRTSRLTSQVESISSDTVVSAHGTLTSHQTNAAIMQYTNNEMILRSYGATAGTGQMVFKTGGGGGSADSEAMRIDSSRNLLVGTTSTDSSTVGARLYGTTAPGAAAFTRDGSHALVVNRLTSDGDVVQFRKGNTTVGSIGSNGGDVYIGTGDTTIRFADGDDAVIPRGTAGAARDGAIDLGISNNRFKDLYLSGGASVITSVENGTAQFKTLNSNVATPAEQFYVGNNLGDVDLGNKRGDLKFFTSTTEKMRLNSSGDLMVGTTGTPNGTSVYGSGFFNTGASGLVQWLSGTSTTSAVSVARFYNPTGNVGSIQISGTSTSYVTSSDQRLKNNIVDAPSASDDIDAIQVRSFDWKADGSHQKYGMVAQELQSVAPEAVSGDADSDEMMGVDYSKLVPMLVKEIQSLRNRVAQLEN